MNRIHDMIFIPSNVWVWGRFGGLSSSRTTWIRGDGNASTLTAQTMFNLSPLYNNWLQAWADVIRNDGVCHIPLQILIRPRRPLLVRFYYYGNMEYFFKLRGYIAPPKILSRNAKWLGHVDKYTVNGLLKRWPDTDYRNWYLGDWATPKRGGSNGRNFCRSCK